MIPVHRLLRRGNVFATLLTVLFAIPTLGATDSSPPASQTEPAASGPPHVCTNYPQAALIHKLEGTTLLRFRITASGTPHDFIVAGSSGSRILDQAAVVCVSDWRYPPATQNGVERDWRTEVAWRFDEAPPMVAQNPHRCVGAPQSGTIIEATVVFTVLADGTVSQIILYQPSGDPALDASLVKCVSSWVYAPATVNGQPVAAVWAARFVWTPQAGLQTLEGNGRMHYCGAGFYPREALREKIEGTTLIGMRILTDGSVADVATSVSSGNSALDRAAEQCVKRWRYKPAVKDGVPVEVKWRAAISWKLSGIEVVEMD